MRILSVLNPVQFELFLGHNCEFSICFWSGPAYGVHLVTEFQKVMMNSPKSVGIYMWTGGVFYIFHCSTVAGAYQYGRSPLNTTDVNDCGFESHC